MTIFWGLQTQAPPASGLIPAGRPSSEGEVPPGGQQAQQGDIYVRGTGAPPSGQSRWNGTAWVLLAPNETRGDVAVIGGDLNTRLSKATERPFHLSWNNAAEGILVMWNQQTADTEWNVVHGLSAMIIDVTVIVPGYSIEVPQDGLITPPGGAVALVPQEVHVPEIDYISANEALLTFQEPVAGTAIVRR